jgi:hypothetical protein
MKPLPTQSPVKPYLDPTSESALADQEADARRAQEIKAKVAALQSTYKWTFERAWNYLREQEPELFLTEEESSPPPKGSEPKRLDDTPRKALKDQQLDQAKKMLKDQVQSSLGEKMSELRLQHPGMSAEELWGQLEAAEPALIAYAARVENDDWPKPPPIYRYVDDKVRDILNLPVKVQAKKPVFSRDEDVVLVEAAGDERNQEMTDQEKQGAIKEGVAKLQRANPKLTFAAGFAMLRRSRPELFS